MKRLNDAIAGFCACTGVLNFLTGQPIMGGIVLFIAVIIFKIGSTNEET